MTHIHAIETTQNPHSNAAEVAVREQAAKLAHMDAGEQAEIAKAVSKIIEFDPKLLSPEKRIAVERELRELTLAKEAEKGEDSKPVVGAFTAAALAQTAHNYVKAGGLAPSGAPERGSWAARARAGELGKGRSSMPYTAAAY